MYISPYVIEPLFFKFSPVAGKGLEEEIREMMTRAGVQISRVMQVDASRRSRHSNAYFTGIGRVKRIVLFDTILTQMNHKEILAILAHEAGHWKKGHILKRLILIETGGLLISYLAFRLLQWGGLAGMMGLIHSSFPAQLVILMFLGSLVAFPFTPLASWLSRRQEWHADQFACELSGLPDALASALIKLSRENLANLHPHPFYAKFFYSHPPVVERVQRLLGKVRFEELNQNGHENKNGKVDLPSECVRSRSVIYCPAEDGAEAASETYHEKSNEPVRRSENIPSEPVHHQNGEHWTD